MTILSDRKESVREGKALTERFRKAASTAIFANRFENALHDSARKSKQRQAAPFSSVTLYQSVRALLDPMRHQHLLGNDDGLATVSGNKQARKGMGSSPATSTRTEAGVHRTAAAVSNARRTQQQKPSESSKEDDSSSVALSDEDDKDFVSSSCDTSAKEHHEREKVHLPTGAEVGMLPRELALTFQNVAKQRLRDLLYPRALLQRLKKVHQLQRASAAQSAAQLPSDFLKKVKLLSEWPADVLNAAYNGLDYVFCSPGAFIRYAGEKAALEGILILAHGSIEAVKRANQQEKRLTPLNTTVVHTYIAPHVFNEHCFLTDEPASRTLRAVSKCDLYFLRRACFDECMAMLPPAVKSSVQQQATAKRQRSVMEFYALYPHTLRQQCRSFQNISLSVLDQLLLLLKSMAVAPNTSLIRTREVPQALLFLRRGRVALFRLIKGEPTHIRTFVAPQTFFENCISERTEYPDMLRTCTECDILSLNFEDLHQLMAQHPQEAADLLEACRGERMHSLSMQQVAFRPLVYQVPLLRTVCNSEELNIITFLFESKVYPAMSIIASKSECCDRIIVLTKGSVSLGVAKGKWVIGEAVGYTALVNHRWVSSAVAINTCETLELRVDLLRAFLKDSGKLELATSIAEALLFPLKFEIEAREQFLEKQGLKVVPKVKELHRTGQLPVPSRNANGSFGDGGSPETPSFRLGHLVDKVRDDVAALFTPLMHPVSSATTRSQSELGFVSICKPEDFGVDFFVPNGMFVPHLTTEERETMVIKAVTAQKRRPFRKMVHVTPFLLVKQK